MVELEVDQFLNFSDNYPTIDVRSPGEYNAGHITKALNIPLFNDEERALIGICYKHKGRKEAVSYGLEIVGPKLKYFVKEAEKLAVDNTVLVHCWRGGMRSSSFSWLLNTAGLKAYTLRKGYKAFRNFALDYLGKLNNIILLGGETGSGKTKILQLLKDSGEQVIDLEEIACHKGSSFGNLEGVKQPSTEQFQNDLFEKIRSMNFNKRIWMEDESHNIGNVFIPDVLWWKMRASPVIRLIISKEKRINTLINDYGKIDSKVLKQSIERIKKRLGGLNTQLALESLEKQDFYQVANICLNYYDKAYKSGLGNRDQSLIHNLEVNQQVEHQLTKNILNMADLYSRNLVS
jgi:tRNA 2-selenouridine synthase